MSGTSHNRTLPSPSAMASSVLPGLSRRRHRWLAVRGVTARAGPAPQLGGQVMPDEPDVQPAACQARRSAGMKYPSPAVLADAISAALKRLASAEATGQAAVTPGA